MVGVLAREEEIRGGILAVESGAGCWEMGACLEEAWVEGREEGFWGVGSVFEGD